MKNDREEGQKHRVLALLSMKELIEDDCDFVEQKLQCGQLLLLI